MHISIATMHCDMQTQLTSIPLKGHVKGHFVTIAKGHFIRMYWEYFLIETTMPACLTNHQFGTVTLCLQKISKFISKTNIML